MVDLGLTLSIDHPHLINYWRAFQHYCQSSHLSYDASDFVQILTHYFSQGGTLDQPAVSSITKVLPDYQDEKEYFFTTFDKNSLYSRSLYDYIERKDQYLQVWVNKRKMITSTPFLEPSDDVKALFMEGATDSHYGKFLMAFQPIHSSDGTCYWVDRASHMRPVPFYEYHDYLIRMSSELHERYLTPSIRPHMRYDEWIFAVDFHLRNLFKQVDSFDNNQWIQLVNGFIISYAALSPVTASPLMKRQPIYDPTINDPLTQHILYEMREQNWAEAEDIVGVLANFLKASQ